MSSDTVKKLRNYPLIDTISSYAIEIMFKIAIVFVAIAILLFALSYISFTSSNKALSNVPANIYNIEKSHMNIKLTIKDKTLDKNLNYLYSYIAKTIQNKYRFTRTCSSMLFSWGLASSIYSILVIILYYRRVYVEKNTEIVYGGDIWK